MPSMYNIFPSYVIKMICCHLKGQPLDLTPCETKVKLCCLNIFLFNFCHCCHRCDMQGSDQPTRSIQEAVQRFLHRHGVHRVLQGQFSPLFRCHSSFAILSHGGGLPRCHSRRQGTIHFHLCAHVRASVYTVHH